MIKPSFDNNNIPVIFSSDNNYFKYLLVTLKSLISNSTKKYNYDIYILDEDISDKYKQMAKKLEKNNVKISFIDMNDYLKDFDTSIFHLQDHFKLPTYYRFFIPKIFNNFNRILYIDCDTLILDDIAELYNTDIGNNLIGAVKDLVIRYFIEKKEPINTEYLYDKLKLLEPKNYFQAGVLIFDIKKLCDFNCEQKCLQTLKEIKLPHYVDQDILNKVLENKVYFLEQKWNILWQMILYPIDYKKVIPASIYKEYERGYKNPKILHFAGKQKPWHHVYNKHASQFWEYAIKTPTFFEIFKEALFLRFKKFDLLIKAYA